MRASIPMMLALLACGDDATADRPTAPTPTKLPSPAPPREDPPPREIPPAVRLAVLRGDELAILDARDLLGAASATYPAEDTEVILDAMPGDRFLLGDHGYEREKRVVLVEPEGTVVLPDHLRAASFLRDGRILASGLRREDRCGAVEELPIVEIHERRGQPPRVIDGALVGLAPDGHTAILERRRPPCAPAARARDRAAADYVTVDVDAPGPEQALAGVLAFGLTTPEGRTVATFETARGRSGRTCVLRIAGVRHAIPARARSCGGDMIDTQLRLPWLGVSPDGRWIAAAVLGTGGRQGALRVFRTADGSVASTRDTGVTAIVESPFADACFSADGTAMALMRADASTVLTTPEDGPERDIGGGECIGFSPDGRYVLLRSDGGPSWPRLARVADGNVEMVAQASDAVWAPTPPR